MIAPAESRRKGKNGPTGVGQVESQVVSHTIHVWYIFTYMDGSFFMVNVGRSTILYMDGMGQLCDLDLTSMGVL